MRTFPISFFATRLYTHIKRIPNEMAPNFLGAHNLLLNISEHYGIIRTGFREDHGCDGEWSTTFNRLFPLHDWLLS